MKLIVGLGNPGREYKNTRHNVGFLVLDNYLGTVKWEKKFNGLCYKGKDVIYLKPQTYMNLSGNCVRDFVNYFKISIDDVLIIQDDLDLPLFKYKLKYKSSSGGHNGIKSIISNLNTDSIPRLKIGISNNKEIDTKDYVLGKFSKENINELNKLFSITKDIIDCFIDNDINECMKRYN